MREKGKIQRLNYHYGLFLNEEEFKLEQEYYILMRHRLNYAMFTPGVLDGMQLIYNKEEKTLTVESGIALEEYTHGEEHLSREIVLLGEYPPVDLKRFDDTKTAWIVIEYDQEEDKDKLSPLGKSSCITEKYNIRALTEGEFEELKKTLKAQGIDESKIILLGQIEVGNEDYPDDGLEPETKAAFRLKELKGAKPVIKLPVTSAAQGGTVTIEGENFTSPRVGFAVEKVIGDEKYTTFVDAPIVEKPDTPSTDTHITVLVPKLDVTIPGGGLESKLRVSNAWGYHEEPFKITG